MNILGCKQPVKPMFFELDIDEPPPVLTLAINPQDFNKTMQKKVTQSRNRPATRDIGAYIYNVAFDELDTLSCNGTSAMFYGSNGLTTEGRRQTLGFKNLNSLVQIYRNNGRNYVTRPLNNQPLVTGGSGLIKTVGRVIIAYDDIIYRGSFDSLSIQEVDAKPFNLSFSFQFTVTNQIDVRNA
jgi:hypothetical protein